MATPANPGPTTVGPATVCKVALVCSGKRSSGEVRIRRWSSSERLARAGKLLAILWGLAIVSIVFPGLHFVLVPAFLLAGPIAAFFAHRQRSAVLGGTGACPACGAPFVVGRCADVWPLEDVCGACRTPVRIERA